MEEMVKMVGKKNFMTCFVMEVRGITLLARKIKKLVPNY